MASILRTVVAIKNKTAVQTERFEVDRFGLWKSHSRCKSKSAAAVESVRRKEPRAWKTHLINSTLRKQSNSEFNWYSVLGNHLQKIKLEDSTQYLEADIFESFKTVSGLANGHQLEHLNLSYTCPEMKGRVVVGGERERFLFMNPHADRFIGHLSVPDIEYYNFAYFSGYEVYIDNSCQVRVKGGDMLRDMSLEHRFCKYYYQQRPNMNRNLETDTTTLYYLADVKSVNKVVSLNRSVFGFFSKNKPVVLEATANTEHFCITEKFIWGVSPFGGVVRVSKRDYRDVLQTTSFQKTLKKKKSEAHSFDKDFFTTIAANSRIVVIASDSKTGRRNTYELYDAKNLRKIDTLIDPHTVQAPIDPVHDLKVFVIKDLCLLAGLKKMMNLVLLALHKYKLHKIHELKLHENFMALWGIMFLPVSNEFMIHGSRQTLHKVRIIIDNDNFRPKPLKEINQNYLKYKKEDGSNTGNEHKLNWIKDLVDSKELKKFTSFKQAIDEFSKQDLQMRKKEL